jgi:hypothetical protein
MKGERENGDKSELEKTWGFLAPLGLNACDDNMIIAFFVICNKEKERKTK